jgi:hypothetical protein
VSESFWDATTNSVKPEFWNHYSEMVNAHAQRTALTTRNPDDIKFEVKLPETVKVPEGFQVKIDDKDPRVPVIRQLAVKHGLSQDAVNELVALDAQQRIEAHTAEMARIATEDAKLGAKAGERKQAVGNWLKGLKDSNVLTSDEYEAVRIYADDAASVTALEKIIAKANGSVPAGGDPAPPKPTESLTERWYGATTPRKVS